MADARKYFGFENKQLFCRITREIYSKAFIRNTYLPLGPLPTQYSWNVWLDHGDWWSSNGCPGPYTFHVNTDCTQPHAALCLRETTPYQCLVVQNSTAIILWELFRQQFIEANLLPQSFHKWVIHLHQVAGWQLNWTTHVPLHSIKGQPLWAVTSCYYYAHQDH